MRRFNESFEDALEEYFGWMGVYLRKLWDKLVLIHKRTEKIVQMKESSTKDRSATRTTAHTAHATPHTRHRTRRTHRTRDTAHADMSRALHTQQQRDQQGGERVAGEGSGAPARPHRGRGPGRDHRQQVPRELPRLVRRRLRFVSSSLCCVFRVCRAACAMRACRAVSSHEFASQT